MLAPSTVNIVLYSLVILFTLLGFIVSMVVFIAMFISRSTIKRNPTDYLLLANSYIAFSGVTPFILDLSIHSIYGHLHPQSSFDTSACRFKAYLMYVNGHVYFYSFLLQSIYRYYRIVSRTRVTYGAFRRYAILSICIWISAFWQTSLYLVHGQIAYVPQEFHCQFPVNDVSSSLTGLSIIFLAPHILTLVCYACTMYHVRKRTVKLTRIHQQIRRRRDLVILQRLVILLALVTLVALPHVMMTIFYGLVGYSPSWASPFEWLTTALASTGVALIQIFVSPRMKQLFF